VSQRNCKKKRLGAVLDLSVGFQGNSKTPQYDGALASSDYEDELMKTISV
jgi:hypothetical protein